MKLTRFVFLALSLLTGMSHAQTMLRTIDDPCFESIDGDCGGGSVSVYFSGPTSANANETKTYNVSVYGGSYYTTTYEVSTGGTITAQNNVSVSVKWTSAGSRWIKANVNVGGQLYTRTVSVNVLTPLTGGVVTASTSTSLCPNNANPGIINSSSPASGGSGSYSYQWQQLDDSGLLEEPLAPDPYGENPSGGSTVTWINIYGATGLTYDPPVLSQSTTYRRKVTSGSSISYSNPIFYDLAPALTAGSISWSGTAINPDQQPAVISGVAATGGDGAYFYQWQQKTTGGFVDITGATNTSFQPPASPSAVTTTYRRKVTSCGTTLYTNQITVPVNLIPGNISTGLSGICSGTDVPPFTVQPASGGTGVYTYTLEKSEYRPETLELEPLEGGTQTTSSTHWIWSAWEPIAAGTNANDPSSQSFNTRYRRKVVSGTTTKYSNILEIPLIENNPGTISHSGSSSVAAGGNTPPITGTTATGSNVSYTWQKKTTGGFTNIPGASGVFHKDLPPQTQHVTTTYRRLASSCGINQPSNEITIEVYLNGGEVTASSPVTVCNETSTDPAVISGTQPASGGTGDYDYFWERMVFVPGTPETLDPYDDTFQNDHTVVGVEPAPANHDLIYADDGYYEWQEIDGATDESFNPGLITNNTLNQINSFRRKVTSGTRTAYSNVITYSFVQADRPVSADAIRQGPGNITLSVNDGASGVYQWYEDFNGNTPIDGATTSSYTTHVTKSRKFYVSRFNGVCESARVQVEAQVRPRITFLDGIDRLGENVVKVTLIGDEGHDSYRWTNAAGDEMGTSNVLEVTKTGEYKLTVTSNGISTVKKVEVTAMNYIVSRSFDETGAEIGKSAQFFDDAGHLMQSQTWDRATNTVFATEPLYDRFRRSVGTTLSAPTGRTELGYKEGFVTANNGQPYNWQAFDNAATHYNPLPVDKDQPGTLGHFYSENNAASPGHTAYPYSRQDFYEDGSGEVKSSAGPGDEFRMGAGHETYGKSLPVLNGELPLYNQLRDLIVFGNKDAGITTTDRLMKSVGRDPNGKEAVSYADETGNTLASLLPGGATGHQLAASPVQLSQEKSVFEFHVPTNEENVDVSAEVDLAINPNSTLRIVDKLTGIEKASGTSVNPTLPPGFYQIEYTGSALNATLAYTLNYTNHAYNFYDNRGRLVASIAPKGMEMLLANPSNIPANKEDLPFTTFYTYDFQGRLLQMDEPDAGITKYKYRKDGLIRFSQNAQQALENKLSYTDYDALGRPVESGELEVTGLVFDNVNPNAVEDAYTVLNATQKNDWIRTHYDLPYETVDEQNNPVIDPYSQTFTIGGVSWTENENVKTIYSYDDQGRVKWIRQLYAELDKEFLVRYAYDFLGNVKTVAYQPQTYNQPETTSEALWHKYSYDANYRLDTVETSIDSVEFYTHATYEYYLHGPLKRVVYADNLQGVDYQYTLQGWLKQINDPTNANDPTGKPDAFGMALDYFGENTPNHPALFNGQIRAQQHRTGTSGGAEKYLYQYDEKYQLKRQDKDGSAAYATAYEYDVNGNILHLERYDASGQLMDDFDYGYSIPNTNQLTGVKTYLDTLIYNEIGQLIYDKKGANERYITYDVSGKVRGVFRDAAMTDTLTIFEYDDRGFRIMKKEGLSPDSYREEWYVRDASGNIMSIYHRDATANSLAQIELPIYGSGKIGNAFRQPDHLNYNYELTDHLGNVRATVSNVHTLAVATMEPDNDAWESQYFDNLSTRHSDPLMAYQSYYSARLNYQQPVGPTLITEVKEGATVHLSAWTKYQSPSPEDNLGAAAGDIYGLLQSALESATTGETALMSPEVPGGLLSGLMNLLNTGTFDPNSPRAYLQYILFDENWGYVTSDEIQVPSAAEGSYAEIKLEDIPVGNDGYLYVYVVNESEIDVHFDNLTVGVLGLNVLSTRNYYPYGSVAYEWRNEDFDDRYRFGYQGQFAEEDTVTGWSHFELREYDAKIGRWLVVDPYKEFYSPYESMGNNPLNKIDPNGGCTSLDCLVATINNMGDVEKAKWRASVGIGAGYRLKEQLNNMGIDVGVDFAHVLVYTGSEETGVQGTGLIGAMKLFEQGGEAYLVRASMAAQHSNGKIIENIQIGGVDYKVINLADSERYFEKTPSNNLDFLTLEFGFESNVWGMFENYVQSLMNNISDMFTGDYLNNKKNESKE